MAFGRISVDAGMAFGVDQVGFQRMQATIFQMHKARRFPVRFGVERAAPQPGDHHAKFTMILTCASICPLLS